MSPPKKDSQRDRKSDAHTSSTSSSSRSAPPAIPTPPPSPGPPAENQDLVQVPQEYAQDFEALYGELQPTQEGDILVVDRARLFDLIAQSIVLARDLDLVREEAIEFRGLYAAALNQNRDVGRRQLEQFNIVYLDVVQRGDGLTADEIRLECAARTSAKLTRRRFDIVHNVAVFTDIVVSDRMPYVPSRFHISTPLAHTIQRWRDVAGAAPAPFITPNKKLNWDQHNHRRGPAPGAGSLTF